MKKLITQEEWMNNIKKFLDKTSKEKKTTSRKKATKKETQ